MSVKDFEVKVAKKMLSILDLTSLHMRTDTDLLYQQTRSHYGSVAGVMVYPEYVAEMKEMLVGEEQTADIKMISVTNFPQGDLNVHRTAADIRDLLLQDIDEIEVVFPYRVLLNRQAGMCLEFLENIREVSQGKILKIILETGALESTKWIRKATELSVKCHADFIVTTTGRHPIKSTLGAANTILAVLHDLGVADRTGIKIAGGVDDFDTATQYLELALERMGTDWVNPKNFRFGSSPRLYESLLSRIEQ